MIDRSKKLSHLTSLYVSPLPDSASLNALAETVAILRGPDGCPWDQEQTPKSLRSGLLEEASEVLAAIDEEDNDSLAEELGDLLYHIVMQAQIASEENLFRLSDVITGIRSKLIRRHPHIWDDWQVANSEEVIQNWEHLKRSEKGKLNSMMDNLPSALPALARAQFIQNRVSKIGFDWKTIQGVKSKVDEEINELERASDMRMKVHEMGDILFALVNLARWLGIDAEIALREGNMRFEHRFREMEQIAANGDLDLAMMDIEDLEALWQEAKMKVRSTI
jgi:tetrapyrrole methylase family protein/MazG family protein